MDLDAIDRQLLTVLQRDARVPLDALAGRVGASVATVQRRSRVRVTPSYPAFRLCDGIASFDEAEMS